MLQTDLGVSEVISMKFQCVPGGFKVVHGVSWNFQGTLKTSSYVSVGIRAFGNRCLGGLSRFSEAFQLSFGRSQEDLGTP